MVFKIEDKVRLTRDRLKVAFDRQKSYVDLTRKDIKFTVGDQVFLKVSLWKKVLRFGRKGKLSSRRYWSDPSHIVFVEKIDVRPDLAFKKEPMHVLNQEVKVLRKKTIS
ncbi:uncharacterized protein LOC128032549 [Gossypium raimondii]|uniref:uncharacterized protein LOC128032549 n=1 Tax=Gossypium raimondii TaxID=29730 RepID=UPI00227B8ECE|nr:uncharacterized protein LOC128032549 [Gossypium raimondii]